MSYTHALQKHTLEKAKKGEMTGTKIWCWVYTESSLWFKATHDDELGREITYVQRVYFNVCRATQTITNTASLLFLTGNAGLQQQVTLN